MTVFRALLACIWVLFSLTATAAPAMAADMPCHMDHMDMSGEPHKPDAPAAPQTVMPCCSQPVLAAEAEPAFLLSRPCEPARFVPAPSAPLTGLTSRLEPRPPKTV